MKIGILYICTGKYDIFWKDFYISCEKYFLKKHEKHYFIFTDSKNIYDSENNNYIHTFYQKNLGWPDNTLMRFHIFLSKKNELEKMDYLFFFNADLELKEEILDEIIPEKEGLLVTQHPGFYNKQPIEYTYDRNKESTAYIEEGNGKYYVAGGFNGGKSKNYIELCEKLSKKIDKDKSKGIIALWHDESHLNNYILYNEFKILDPGYLFPEGRKIPFDCKIMIRDKIKMNGFGIYYILQGRGFNLIVKILLLIRYLKYKIGLK